MRCSRIWRARKGFFSWTMLANLISFVHCSMGNAARLYLPRTGPGAPKWTSWPRPNVVEMTKSVRKFKVPRSPEQQVESTYLLLKIRSLTSKSRRRGGKKKQDSFQKCISNLVVSPSVWQHEEVLACLQRLASEKLLDCQSQSAIESFACNGLHFLGCQAAGEFSLH